MSKQVEENHWLDFLDEPPRDGKREHKHKLKLIDFNEDTGVGKWACKCGFEKERTAAFMCAVPGAE